jgi:hypothetical protein
MTKKNRNRNFIIFFVMIFCSTISCKKSEQTYYYDKSGFTPQNGYYNAPSARIPSQYSPYNQPYSGAYQNPYASPPKNYYPYYDSDHYYIPPTNYQTIPTDNTHGGPGPNTK